MLLRVDECVEDVWNARQFVGADDCRKLNENKLCLTANPKGFTPTFSLGNNSEKDRLGFVTVFSEV